MPEEKNGNNACEHKDQTQSKPQNEARRRFLKSAAIGAVASPILASTIFSGEASAATCGPTSPGSLASISSQEAQQTEILLTRLRDNVAYFASAIDNELTTFSSSSQDAAAVLRARGFAYAHAGLNTPAIDDLNALVSQKGNQTPDTLIKFAQVRIRRAAESADPCAELETAVSIVEQVLTHYQLTSSQERFALHNLATANLLLGNYTAAAHAADDAQYRDPELRTELIKELAVANGEISNSTLQDYFADEGVFPVAAFSGADAGQRSDMAVVGILRDEPMA